MIYFRLCHPMQRPAIGLIFVFLDPPRPTPTWFFVISAPGPLVQIPGTASSTVTISNIKTKRLPLTIVCSTKFALCLHHASRSDRVINDERDNCQWPPKSSSVGRQLCIIQTHLLTLLSSSITSLSIIGSLTPSIYSSLTASSSEASSQSTATATTTNSTTSLRTTMSIYLPPQSTSTMPAPTASISTGTTLKPSGMNGDLGWLLGAVAGIGIFGGLLF